MPFAPKEMTDEQLMKKVKAGDFQPLGILFDRHRTAIYNFFIRMTWDRLLSEDLTQLTFERILRYRHSFQVERSFKAWMYQIARNVCTRQLERAERFQEDQIVNWETLAMHSASVEAEIEQQETLDNLEWALSKLNQEYREVLLLTRYAQLKYAEVAELLNCTENAVKVKVYRATQQLRKLFFKIDAI